MGETSFRDERLGRFLERVAAKDPAPGGGAAAGVAAAMAASLVAMAARFSTNQLEDAQGLAEVADRLRERALELADQDAAAYPEVRAAYRLPKEPDPDARRARIKAALEHATEIPLQIARAAAETAVLAQKLEDGGNPNLRGDAATATLLAGAAVRASAALVELNVRFGKLEGDWLDRSAELLATLGDARPNPALCRVMPVVRQNSAQ
ncbi:MAG: cyclodeaminase/cyclohydrolase family protein [Egibacteraceae bacterium]